MRNCDWQGSDYKNSRKRYSIIISHFVTTLIAEKDAFQENHLGNNENAFLGIVIIKLLVLFLDPFGFVKIFTIFLYKYVFSCQISGRPSKISLVGDPNSSYLYLLPISSPPHLLLSSYPLGARWYLCIEVATHGKINFFLRKKTPQVEVINSQRNKAITQQKLALHLEHFVKRYQIRRNLFVLRELFKWIDSKVGHVWMKII